MINYDSEHTHTHTNMNTHIHTHLPVIRTQSANPTDLSHSNVGSQAYVSILSSSVAGKPVWHIVGAQEA